MAESDSDTTLGLEQNSTCRRRTPSTETKLKMNTSPLRQQKYRDDSVETKWLPSPDVAIRRYFFFCNKKKQSRTERKANAIVGVFVDSFLSML